MTMVTWHVTAVGLVPVVQITESVTLWMFSCKVSLGAQGLECRMQITESVNQ